MKKKKKKKKRWLGSFETWWPSQHSPWRQAKICSEYYQVLWMKKKKFFWRFMYCPFILLYLFPVITSLELLLVIDSNGQCQIIFFSTTQSSLKLRVRFDKKKLRYFFSFPPLKRKEFIPPPPTHTHLFDYTTDNGWRMGWLKCVNKNQGHEKEVRLP